MTFDILSWTLAHQL